MLLGGNPGGTCDLALLQSMIDSIKGRNPAIGVSHVVNFTALKEVQREMKIK